MFKMDNYSVSTWVTNFVNKAYREHCEVDIWAVYNHRVDRCTSITFVIQHQFTAHYLRLSRTPSKRIVAPVGWHAGSTLGGGLDERQSWLRWEEAYTPFGEASRRVHHSLARIDLPMITSWPPHVEHDAGGSKFCHSDLQVWTPIDLARYAASTGSVGEAVEWCNWSACEGGGRR